MEDLSNRQVLELVEGFRRLRRGALMSIISVAMVFASFAILFFLAIGSAFPMRYPPTYYPGQIPQTFGAGIAAMGVTVLAVMLVALILTIIAFILWFMATGNLKRYNPERFGIGRLGMVLQLIGIILIVVGGVAGLALIGFAASAGLMAAPSAFGAFFGFLAILILAAILAIIGAILFAIMFIRFPEDARIESGFKTAGILYLIGVILSIIPFVSMVGSIIVLVAVILIFIYSGSTLRRLEALPETQPKG